MKGDDTFSFFQRLIKVSKENTAQRHSMRKEFEKMLINNQGRLRYIAARYARDGEFDDIYQEILLQLWRSFSTFDGQSALETWVYKVAFNTACTFVKSAIKHRDIKQSPLNKAIDQSLPGHESCQADVLNQFMDTLNDIDANLLMMYLDGLTSEDSAQVLGISTSAVRSRIKRIKQAFEKQFIGE